LKALLRTIVPPLGTQKIIVGYFHNCVIELSLRHFLDMFQMKILMEALLKNLFFVSNWKRKTASVYEHDI
jgi:hypothetical protein